MNSNRYLSWVMGWLCLLGTSDLLAQDPVLSQYFTNRMLVNPALTGFERGSTVSMNHRNQWFRVGGRETRFTTNSLTADIGAPCLQSAFGVYYLDNVEGAGLLRWQHTGLSYAWHSRPGPMNSTQDIRFSGGFKASYNWRRLNYDNLIFSDQLDAIYGRIGATAAPIPSEMEARTGYADFGAGAAVHWRHRTKNRLTVGGAMHHLVRIDNSVAFLDDTLPTRTTLHATYVHAQSYGNFEYFIVPMAKVELQRSAAAPNAAANPYWYRMVTYGVAFSFQNSPGLWGGMWMHTRNGIVDTTNTNTLTVALGIEVGDGPGSRLRRAGRRMRVGLSYDYNFSGLRSDSGGVMELSLTFNFADVKLTDCDLRGRLGDPPCPKFN